MFPKITFQDLVGKNIEVTFPHVAQPELLPDCGARDCVHVNLCGHFEGIGVRWGFGDLDEVCEPVVLQPSS